MPNLPDRLFPLAVCLLLTVATSAQRQKAEKKPKAPAKSVLMTYDIRDICKTLADSEKLSKFLRGELGDHATVDVIDLGLVLIRARPKEQKRAQRVMNWLHKYEPLRCQVEVQELRGDKKSLATLSKGVGTVLIARTDVAAFLKRANRIKGVTLKNHPPTSLSGLAPTAVDKLLGTKPGPRSKDKPATEKTEPGLRIGATYYSAGAFSVRTWAPKLKSIPMREGQTRFIVEDDRILLIRFAKVTSKLRDAR